MELDATAKLGNVRLLHNLEAGRLDHGIPAWQVAAVRHDRGCWEPVGFPDFITCQEAQDGKITKIAMGDDSSVTYALAKPKAMLSA